MKKILIVGLGHGGLIAGGILAKKGYDVQIIEKKQSSELGHDWEDRFNFALLTRLTGKAIPDDIWRYRGDTDFVSPSQRTDIILRFEGDKRQKIMDRKALLNILIDYAVESGAKIQYGITATEPIIDNDYIKGVKTNQGEYYADLTIDASGVFSVIREKMPYSSGIIEHLSRGDVFFAYRAYYKKIEGEPKNQPPFNVYLCHECEQGLSWYCTNKDTVDILIGRIDKLDDNKVNEQLAIFKSKKPWFDKTIIRGGNYGIIPVRRGATQIVANGYAMVGDSAFMTTPMNGMGIDLSMQAGELLANTIIECGNNEFSTENLWDYNVKYHQQFGGDTAKNEGLKNTLLNLPPDGVDFLFDNGIIQSSDLAGGGKNTNIINLLTKFIHGMRNPKYFFAVINGLIKGAKQSSTYKKIPKIYDKQQVEKWREKVEKSVVIINREG